MTDRSLRWGFICTARINEALIHAIRASARSELVAVASRDLGRAQNYADQWGIPRAHGSYQALLDDPEIEIIYNALPNSLHCEWTVRAAAAGKNILCEKPLALTVEEVDRMIESARRNEVLLFEAFMYRHHPQTLKVQDLVQQGVIGDVRLIRAFFSFMLDYPDAVRLEPALGGGSLWDMGCYPVSFAQAIQGAEPIDVFGCQVLGDSGVDMTFAGQLHFADDVLAQIYSSYKAPLRFGAEVVGSEGTLTLEHPWLHIKGPVGIRLRDDKGETTLDVEDVDPYLCEVETMANCILDGAKPILSLAASRGIVATLNALYESARTGEAVSMARRHANGG